MMSCKFVRVCMMSYDYLVSCVQSVYVAGIDVNLGYSFSI